MNHAGSDRIIPKSIGYRVAKNSTGGNSMVKFYDPKDAADLAWIEAMLQRAGIEYSLAREPETRNRPATSAGG